MILHSRVAAALLVLPSSFVLGAWAAPAQPGPVEAAPSPAEFPAALSSPSAPPDLPAVPPPPRVPAQALAASLPPWADVSTVLGDTASVLAWPLRLDLAGGAAVGAASAASLVLFRHDVRFYRHVQRHVRWTFHGSSVFHQTLLLGDGLVDAGIVSLFALAGPRGKRVAVRGLQALLSVAVTSVIAKAIFRVPRPQVDPDSRTFFAGLRDDAFPSGHTMSAFAVATVISGEFPWGAPVAFGAASLVGLSVIKRGWHWPSDVLAGAVLGVVIGRTGLLIDRERGFTLGPTPGGLGLAIAGAI